METNSPKQVGQIRRSDEEGRRLAETWRASGLSAAEFGRKHGVGPHVLRYWADRTKAEKPDPADKFVVVTTDGASAIDDATAGTSDTASNATAVLIVLPLQSGSEAFSNALRAILAEVRS